MKKLFQAALITAAMILLGSQSGLAQTPKTTLKVSTWTATSPGLKDWWPLVVKDFEAQHPNVTVEVQQVAFANFIQTLTTQFIAGSPPDIVHVPLPTINMPAWTEANFLRPLDAEINTTDIAKIWPKNQAAMTWGGKNYGVLLVDYGFVLFYNDALLKQAGLALPTTPEQMVSAAAALTKDGRYGFAITDDNSPNFVRDVLEFVTGMGGELAKNGKWNLTDPKVVQAVDTWRTLATKYSPKGTDINAKRQAFYDGNVAMMIENPSVWPNVQSAGKADIKASLHLAALPFPVVPGDTSHGLAVPASLRDDRAKLVWDFIKLAAAPKSMSEYAGLVKSPVARPGASDVLKSDPDTAVIAKAQENATLLIPNEYMGVRKNYADFATAMAAGFRSLLQGNTRTSDVLQSLQNSLTSAGINP